MPETECQHVPQTPSLPAPIVEYDPQERRTSDRWVALEYRAWIAWWDEEDSVAVSCRVLDISRGGVAIEAERLPPRDVDVFFRFQHEEVTDMLACEVVGSATGTQRRYRIRLAFWEPCPRRVLDLALHGPQFEARRDPTTR